MKITFFILVYILLTTSISSASYLQVKDGNETILFNGTLGSSSSTLYLNISNITFNENISGIISFDYFRNYFDGGTECSRIVKNGVQIGAENCSVGYAQWDNQTISVIVNTTDNISIQAKQQGGINPQISNFTIHYEHINGQITFVNISNNSVIRTTSKNALVNSYIYDDNISSILFNWNDTNKTINYSKLLIHYNFDNNAFIGDNNTNIVDITGKYNASIVGVLETVNGTYGGSAYKFFATNNYINNPRLDNYKIKSNLTLSAWINFSNYTNSKNIVGWWWGVNSTFIRINDNKPMFQLRSNLTTTQVLSGIYLNDSQWHNIVGTFNSSKSINNANIYIDGTLRGSSNTAGTLETDNLFNIGNTNNDATGSYIFNGSIDEVSICECEWDSKEIEDNYNIIETKLRNNKYGVTINQTNITYGAVNYYNLSYTNNTNIQIVTENYILRFLNKIKNKVIII